MMAVENNPAYASLVDALKKMLGKENAALVVRYLEQENAVVVSIVDAILKISTDQSMEERLGRVEYSMTVHENVKRITMPIRRHDLLLISTKHISDHEKIIQKVLPLVDIMC